MEPLRIFEENFRNKQVNCCKNLNLLVDDQYKKKNWGTIFTESTIFKYLYSPKTNNCKNNNTVRFFTLLANSTFFF